MSRQSTPCGVAGRGSPRARLLGVAALVAAILASPGAAEATWGILPLRVPRPTPPDQTWLKDIPDRPGANAKSKVAVFEFKGDDVYQPVRAAVVRVLRRRGLNVIVTLRQADSAAEYRDMSHELNMAVYVEGEMKGEGDRQTVSVYLMSGVSGRRMRTVKFMGPTEKIVGEIARDFWTRVGPSVTRARTSVTRPRQREHQPLLIDAGEPDDS